MILEIACPDEVELTRLVRQVIRGEAGPLDEVVSSAIFAGQDRPRVWGEWPEEAVQAWSTACRIYNELMGEDGPGEWARGSRNDLTIPSSWKIVLRVAPEPQKWWRMPGVTWAVFGEALGTSPRLASYRMTRLGWRLTGAGMNVPDRRIVSAPCVSCGQIWKPDDIRRKHGPCCS